MKRIFVSAFAFDEGKSGISNYIENTLYNLAHKNKVYVAILSSDIKNFTKKHENIHFIMFPDFLKNTILNLIFHMFILPFFVSKDKYDFMFLPAGNRRLMAFYPIYTIVTFHDLSQFNVKNKYDALRMFYIKYFIPLFLKPVNRIIAVSKNTKEDLLKYFDLKNKRISVNYNGFDKDLYKKDTDEKFDFPLAKEYFLYVARIEHPGKNHLNLIKAYEKLPLEVKEKYDLVFAGTFKEGSQVVLDYIDNSKDKHRIKLLGFVSTSKLPVLFKNAKLFIFPSFYEGFGIPLVEAMAMGTPVLSASNSSLLEIGQESSIFFDEKNPEDIKNKIEHAVSNEVLLSTLVQRGFEKLDQFDWRNHAKTILELYRAR